MTYRIELSRSEAHDEGERIRVVESPLFVQVTYGELRVGPEGDSLADFKEGVWVCRDGPDEWYSDVTVTEWVES